MNHQLLDRCALVLFLGLTAFSSVVDAATKTVSYEDFGAKGDGITDDLPAIQKAHEHANQNGLPVRSKPGATYHLGTKALIAVIATDTDWNTSKFIIDDSQGVEKFNRSIFEVHSLLDPVSLKIDRLKKDQTRLNIRPPVDCLVFVENSEKMLFIRKGGNQNNGTAQKEVFVLKRDGSIVGAIDWDYDKITKIEAIPIDEKVLTLKGGIFTNIANQDDSSKKSGYWRRNISIVRSKTLVEGLTHRVTGEKETGLPYAGFLYASQCAHILFRDCVVDGRKVYHKIGNAGRKVPMGTYGYHADLVVDFRMVNCRMGNDIHDTSRWGVVASNFMKNFTVEDCVLSRVDVHMGVSGEYVIRRTNLGHAGLNAIGRGQLIVEDSTIESRRLLNFRDDYGANWDGDVLIKNTMWIPRGGKEVTMFGGENDGSHDFGYPCSMPRLIRIDGLKIKDEQLQSIRYFDNPIGKSSDKRPYPYRITERIEVSELVTSNNLKPSISSNPELVGKIKLIEKP